MGPAQAITATIPTATIDPQARISSSCIKYPKVRFCRLRSGERLGVPFRAGRSQRLRSRRPVLDPARFLVKLLRPSFQLLDDFRHDRDIDQTPALPRFLAKIGGMGHGFLLRRAMLATRCWLQPTQSRAPPGSSFASHGVPTERKISAFRAQSPVALAPVKPSTAWSPRADVERPANHLRASSIAPA